MALSGDPSEAGFGRGTVLLVVGLVLAVLGHGAWYANVDTSAGPYLPEGAADAKIAVTRAFPNATPPTMHVLLVADEDGDVLSPDALTALAGLRNRISSDPTTAPLLSEGRPLASVVGVLEPHLEGGPGEWDRDDVERAVADATATPQGRRSVGAYLDMDADLDQGSVHADATALVVRLSATADPADLERAQERIAELADQATVRGVDTATTSPALRDQAARSPLGLWIPIGTLLLVPVGVFLAGVRPRSIPAWLVTFEAAAGSALLVGWGLGHTTPSALLTAHSSAGLGLTVLAVGRADQAEQGPGWRWALPVAPLAALVGWAPAGVGQLAAIAATAALVPIAAGALVPGQLELTPRWRFEGGGRSRLEDLPAPTGPVAAGVLVLGLLVTAGLPAEALGGWRGSLPDATQAGQAEQAIETHFGGTAPGAQLAIAAWGPTQAPGFLGAVDETSERLEKLTLATSESSVESVLALARDWATNETASDPSDRYDPAFARAWQNATDEGDVPRRNVSMLLDQLRELAPSSTRAYLAEDPEGSGGAALIRQEVSVSDVVPRPAATVDAALQPLVAASDRVAEGGSALDGARAAAAVDRASVPALAAVWIVAALAGALWLGARGRSAAYGLLVGGLAGAPALATVTLAGLVGAALQPAVIVGTGWIAGLGLIVACPAVGGEADEVPRRLSRSAALVAPIVLAVLAPILSEPADALRSTGWAIGVGVLAVAGLLGVALPGLAREASTVGRGELDGRELAPAHARCPVCQRQTATAVSRCPSCGRWNLLEACPGHPRAVEANCAECGSRLGEPRFD